MQEIVLSAYQTEVGILPEVGGSVSFLKHNGVDILRPTDLTKEKIDANQTAMFVMLPYPGRIRGGSFTYWGILRKVPKTHPAFPDPIHGDGWRNEWQVIRQDNTSVVLGFNHQKENGGYPFTYQAELTYTVTPNGLTIQITVTNPNALPMPYGLGIHPFFIKEKDTTLDFISQVVWSNEADPIFDQPYMTPAAWQFSGGKQLKNTVFDTCFGGFNETAAITYPSLGKKIKITTNELFHHVVLFSPKGKNFFCLEPTTCASNAFNLAAGGVIGTGIRSIGPGQTITGNISISIQG